MQRAPCIGSSGSILSVGSSGAVLSVGSAGGLLAIGGHSLLGRRGRPAAELATITGEA